MSAAWVHPARRTGFPHSYVPGMGHRFLRRFPTDGDSGERPMPQYAALAALVRAEFRRPPLSSG